MNKVLVFAATLIILIGIIGLNLFFNTPQTIQSLSQPTTQNTPTPSVIEATASFGIFTNGTIRIFTDKKYHNLSSDVYIETDTPSVIHVKKSGITWGDFFATLPMKVTNDCLTTGTGQMFCTNTNALLKFYINGKLTPSALEKVITNGDQLVISFGNENDIEIQQQLQQITNLNKE